MARDEFFQDIRRAVSSMTPRVKADSPLTDTCYIQRMLQGADLWLSQKVVEAFSPDDYPDLGDRGSADFAQAVTDFLTVAKTVQPTAPTKQEQRGAAIRPFT